MNLGHKLKRLLADKRANAIARRAGIHPVTLSAYCNHSVMPSADVVYRLARILGVTADYLLDDRQSWPPVMVPPEPMEPIAA